MMENDWINIHTHHPGRGINIVDPCLGEVQAPEDGKIYYSMGIHPMYIDGHAGQKIEEIERAAAEKRIVAIGEAGMDRNSAVPMAVQAELFERQARLAVRYDLPLIIHGVRAIPELITIRKKWPACKGWIIHGFNNREEILRDLLRHGFYISAGRHVMNGESHIFQLLPKIPSERLFIETDNSDLIIEDIYGRVALGRGENLGELQRIVRANFDRLFNV